MDAGTRVPLASKGQRLDISVKGCLHKLVSAKLRYGEGVLTNLEHMVPYGISVLL